MRASVTPTPKRVALDLITKARLSAKLLMRKLVLRMMYYSVMTQANSEKKFRVLLSGVEPEHSEFLFPSLPVSLLNNTSFSFVHQA